MQTSLWPGGPTLTLPDYWRPLRTLPHDPPDTQVFAFKFSNGATGSLKMHPIPPDEAMPLDQQELIDDLRGANEVLAGQAGLIDVDAARTASGIPYVYSLMKIPGEHRGIHYNLTLHLVGDRTLQIWSGFDEGDVTGIREAVGYEMALHNNMLHEPTPDDPTGGWGPIRPLHNRLRHEHERTVRLRSAVPRSPADPGTRAAPDHC